MTIDTPPVDARAISILFDTFWSTSGWRADRDRFTSDADLQYAKDAGVMFDAVWRFHDETVSMAVAAAKRCDRRSVADAFVVSLNSRRLDLRSALGSFAVLQHFPLHAGPLDREPCEICGAWDSPDRPKDLNVRSFERHKWGGVRHSEPLYAQFDLELFSRVPGTRPSIADVQALRSLLSAIKAVPASTSSSPLQKHLATVIKSNKAERDVLVGILGLCGILGTPAHPGYLQRFIPYSERTLPPRRFVDMAYPACWWKRSDGINQDAVTYWFGHLL